MGRFNKKLKVISAEDACIESLDRYQYCGWRQVGGVINVPALSSGTGSINTTVAAHFEPKTIYIFGINPAAPSMNMRFTVGAITVGGRAQTANYTSQPNGLGQELLSDVFNRPDQPLIIDGWAIFSAVELGAAITFHLFNLNPVPIRVFVSFWGNIFSEAEANRLKREQDDEEEERNVIPKAGPMYGVI